MPDKCGECPKFKKAENYQKERAMGGKHNTVIMRIDDEVEEEIDRALGQLEEKRNAVKAENKIRELYSENPDLFCTQYAMGVVHIVKEQMDEAISYLRQAADSNPFAAEPHFNLSSCYQAKLQIVNAIRSLWSAQELVERDDPLRRTIDNSLQEYADIIKKNDGIDLETYVKGSTAFEQGVENMENKRWRQAIIDFKESLGHKPQTYQAYGNIGLCRAKLGEKAQAMEMLEKALEIDPSYELAQWNLKAVKEMEDGVSIPDMKMINYGEECYRERNRGKDKPRKLSFFKE